MSKLMLFGCSLLFLFAILVNDCDSFPYQFLPMKEGYVPVYIRLGDTPLNDINPELAVAFHEVAVNGRQLKSNDEFINDPQEVQAVQAAQMAQEVHAVQAVKVPPQLEKRIDTDPTIEEHVEPQPVEHKV